MKKAALIHAMISCAVKFHRIMAVKASAALQEDHESL